MPTGFPYEDATAICESAVGTIKSRVTSARTQLWVVGQPIKADSREPPSWSALVSFCWPQV